MQHNLCSHRQSTFQNLCARRPKIYCEPCHLKPYFCAVCSVSCTRHPDEPGRPLDFPPNGTTLTLPVHVRICSFLREIRAYHCRSVIYGSIRAPRNTSLLCSAVPPRFVRDLAIYAENAPLDVPCSPYQTLCHAGCSVHQTASARAYFRPRRRYPLQAQLSEECKLSKRCRFVASCKASSLDVDW